MSFNELHINMEDLMNWTKGSDEMPFARALPEFPIKTETLKKRKLETNETHRPPPHIPDFLPPFPERHSFVKSPLYVARETDPLKIREMNIKQRRQVANSLAKIHEQCNKDEVVNYDSFRDSQFHPPDLGNGQAYQDKMEVELPKFRVPPTPLPKDSDYIMETYLEAAPIAEEEDRAEYSASDKHRKRQKIEKILALEHKNNVIESIESPDRQSLKVKINKA